MRALITGGAGYIGSVVSNHLLDEGHEVIIIDNLSTGMINNIPKKAEFLKLDIADTKKYESKWVELFLPVCNENYNTIKKKQ